MKKIVFFLAIIVGSALPPMCHATESSPVRLIVVDSYHSNYQWSQDTSKGFSDALLSLGYLDNREQIDTFRRENYIENSHAVIKRLWMDTKRKASKEEQSSTSKHLTAIINKFKPDLIFLGDDNAANYIGNQFLDTEIPLVFWGVNNTPIKYGLIDSIEKPGHNVTGVYQKTYYKESLDLLKKIVPQVKTFAILSDDTTTGRIHNKVIEHLDRKGELPVKLMETVATNEYEVWKQKALELQNKVDAFFVASSNGLKDAHGKVVSNEEAAKWYLENISIPGAVGFRYRVELGWLCAADDSGYNQGYEAVHIAHDILVNGFQPALYPPRSPKRGPLMVNRERADMLGLTLTNEMGIEEYIEKASALNASGTTEEEKKKLLIIDSYHRGYDWSMSVATGLNAAMLELKFFDNERQIEEFNKNDFVETSKLIIQKLWLDSKRKNSGPEIDLISLQFYEITEKFKPDMILLGDDNAVKSMGPKFLDSAIPIVFWGLNNTPIKYGLVENKEKPGHNVTGVYQTGYHLESFDLLTKLAPEIKSFAILSDAAITGRNYTKAVERLAQRNRLPLRLTETVITNDYQSWQANALELQEKADALFLSHFAALQDKEGNYVSTDEIIQWYLAHITIPETMGSTTYVKKGLLCAALDSGYNQGYEAILIAFDILVSGLDPATYKPRTPDRGPRAVNRKRAEMLGISLTDQMNIEKIVETSVVD